MKNLILGICVFSATTAFAKLPAGFKEALVAKGFTSPTTMEFAPDGRLFVAEQRGQLKIVKDKVVLEKPFLSVEADDQGEHGLLGIAFDPQFDLNHFIYIYYTAKTPAIHNRVSRFTADGDVAVSGSEKILLDLPDTQGSIFHSAGGIHFGPDGKLYIGVGDNGGRPQLRNSQLLVNPFGKILRINSDGEIPTDNPWYSMTQGTSRAIWALGFRNPFTFSFQTGTNRMFVNDVGAEDWEEINEGFPNTNYGWPDRVGVNDDPHYHNPLFAYPHKKSGNAGKGPFTGCAITGGAFYSSPSSAPSFPAEYVGQYFFVDYCENWIKILNSQSYQVSDFGTDLAPNPLSIIQGPDGALYYISRWQKAIYKIRYQAPS